MKDWRLLAVAIVVLIDSQATAAPAAAGNVTDDRVVAEAPIGASATTRSSVTLPAAAGAAVACESISTTMATANKRQSFIVDSHFVAAALRADDAMGKDG